MKTVPDNGDAMSKDIDTLHRLVADTEDEKHRRSSKNDFPRDLFGIVSLLPRRLMGAALVFSLMAASALATWVISDRNTRQQNDGETQKYLVTVLIPRINERLSAVEMDVASVKGEGQRRDREVAEIAKAVNEVARAQARIEGKLDRALR